MKRSLQLIISSGLTIGATLLSAPANAADTSAEGKEGEIITFEAPGAGTGAFQGTLAFCINPSGMVTGTYTNSNGVTRGFLRAANGRFTTFQVRGAGPLGTNPQWINPAGTITGLYFDPSSTAHGFFRAANGTITTFDAPGAGTGAFQGTFPSIINRAGEIAGYYQNASSAYQGFVRKADGTITTFNAPAAGAGPVSAPQPAQRFQGTYLFGLDNDGTLAGAYAEPNDATHGFISRMNGNTTTTTSFDVPGSVFTFGIGISPMNDFITGDYLNNITGPFHGFVRYANGGITRFEVPGAGTGTYQGTQSFSVNSAGTSTGFYVAANGVSHGFVRYAGGRITKFDAPKSGTAAGQGTFAFNINDEGMITGYTLDANNVFHGFVFKTEEDNH
jgi:hypothetical protein